METWWTVSGCFCAEVWCVFCVQRSGKHVVRALQVQEFRSLWEKLTVCQSEFFQASGAEPSGSVQSPGCDTQALSSSRAVGRDTGRCDCETSFSSRCVCSLALVTSTCHCVVSLCVCVSARLGHVDSWAVLAQASARQIFPPCQPLL